MKNLSQNGRSPCQDLNPGPPEYKAFCVFYNDLDHIIFGRYYLPAKRHHFT
jgi:hypothetical protein